MQAQTTQPYGAGLVPNPYYAYGAPAGFAPLTDEAGVYLPTGPGDAQRMELLNMPGDGSDVWLDVRTVQLYLQISLTSIYKLIHQGEIPAVKLGTKTNPPETILPARAGLPHPNPPEDAKEASETMLANIISLVSGCVTFLGGFLIVWGAVSLGLAIREQQGGAQIASAISTIAGGADGSVGALVCTYCLCPIPLIVLQ